MAQACLRRSAAKPFSDSGGARKATACRALAWACHRAGSHHRRLGAQVELQTGLGGRGLGVADASAAAGLRG